VKQANGPQLARNLMIGGCYDIISHPDLQICWISKLQELELNISFEGGDMSGAV